MGFIEDFLLSSDADSRASEMLNQARRSGGAWLCLGLSILWFLVNPPKGSLQIAAGAVCLPAIAFLASTQLRAIGMFMVKRRAECDRASEACVTFYTYCRNRGIDDVESPQWKEMVQAIHDLKIGLGKF